MATEAIQGETAESVMERWKREWYARWQAEGAPGPAAVAAPSAAALGFWKIALAVFVGNVLTAALVALVWSGLK